MMSPRLLLPFGLLLLLGCRQSSDAPPAPPTDHVVEEVHAVDPVEPAPADTTTPAQTALILDTVALAPEPDTPLKLLLEGTFQKNEVWGGAEEKEWLGLFREDSSYVLRPADLHITAVKISAEGGDSLLVGRQVTAADPNALFFVTGLRHAVTGTVDTAAFSTNTLAANKSLIYTFEGKEYRIQAYGDSVQADSGVYKYQNYGWKALGSKNGRKVEQTLVEDQHFEDSIYLLLWAGDLDRDGIPDLLLDLSNHYSISRYALYLSSMAERGKLYKKVAEFRSVGS